MKEIREALITMAKQAGDYAQEHFGKLKKEDIGYKYEGERGIVTSVDEYLDTFIRGEILRQFPDHDIISEENESINNSADIVWIIDPIDGTRNYANGISNYCISIGVAQKGIMVLGVIYAPALNEFYFAERGKGVWLNNSRLPVTNSQANICYIDHKRLSHPTIAQQFEGCNYTHLGTAALELAYVAHNKSRGSILENIMIWDISAGILMVEEMGGKLLNFEGKSFTLADTNLVALNSYHDFRS